MKPKKILIMIICILLGASCIGCKKANDTYLSNSSVSSNMFLPSLPTETVTSTEQSSTQSTTSTTSSSTPDSSESDLTFEEKHGFNRLTQVEYECLKDIPAGDAQFEITTVRTDKGYALIYMIDLTCKEKTIIIDDRKVTIPYEYRKNHDSLTVTATHRTAGVSLDFEIKFDQWELVFEDNFDGTELNTDVWNVWDEMRDWRYSYSKDNMFLDGKGNLINRMTVEDNPDSPEDPIRMSGAITTKDKYETTYGYFEVRMKPHLNAGLMGAFWLMAGDMGNKDAADDGTAVNGCEVDIIETFYNNLNPSQTIHWDGYTHTKTKGLYNQTREDIFEGKYHTFGFLWTPEEYVFYIDGEVTARTDVMGICNQPGYLLISSHFNDKAGEFVGNQTDMAVDYVRVYKTEDLK